MCVYVCVLACLCVCTYDRGSGPRGCGRKTKGAQTEVRQRDLKSGRISHRSYLASVVCVLLLNSAQTQRLWKKVVI